MDFFIGVEGGGTKSTFLAVDCYGNFISKSLGESTNITSAPLEDIKKTLAACINSLLVRGNLRIDDCMGFCIGTAGINREEDKRNVAEIVRSLGISCPIMVVNDTQVILAAAGETGAGVVLISGTGSIAYGVNSIGISCFAGGWGHLIGDEGSGYWIGKEAVNRAVKGAELTGPPTQLSRIIIEHLGLRNFDELLGWIYDEPFNKKKIASLAETVDLAYGQGDAEAEKLLKEAAFHLFTMAKSVIVRLSLEDEGVLVVMHGGVILNNKLIRSEFTNLIKGQYPSAKISSLEREACWGAAALARSLKVSV